MNNWEILNHSIVYQDDMLSIGKRDVKLGNNSIHKFTNIYTKNWVNAVVLTEDNKVVLVKQNRNAALKQTLEIPGGRVNQQEDFLESCKREVLEETGYSSDNWEFLGEILPNPNLFSNKLVSYICYNAKKVSNQNLDPAEEIEVELFSIDEIKEMLLHNKIDAALSIAPLSLGLFL